MSDSGRANGRAVLSPVERRRRNRDEMTGAILEAARAIMREHGAAALNLHEVARRVGLRTPSLYAYFSSKADLYDALFRLGVQKYAERLHQAMAEPLSLWDAMRAALETYMGFAHDCPELYQLVFERPVPGFTPSPESMEASLTLLAEANEIVADRFRTEGIVLPLPVNQATDLIIALNHGLTALHLANEPHLPPGEGRFGSLVPAAVELIKAAWGAQPTTQKGSEETK
ncbi:MAG TPA: TetR/AcrR family transcriptional regulator [Chloroflexia bacterium]|nr:TetR/AcrR family transcriptional regulator [Chloroflexia bacterium]